MTYWDVEQIRSNYSLSAYRSRRPYGAIERRNSQAAVLVQHPDTPEVRRQVSEFFEKHLKAASR